MADASYPDDLKYHPEHDWARIDGDVATFGITWYAQDQLGEVVFVDPPEVGKTVSKDEPYAEIESVKAVSDVVAPLSGEIVEVNEALGDAPEQINEDPYGDGWLVQGPAQRPVRGRGAAGPRGVRGQPDLSRYTSATDADRQGDARAHRRRVDRRAVRRHPRGRPARPADRPAARQAGAGGVRVPARPGGAQRLGRGRDHLPRRRHVRPLRPVAGRRAALALGVPDPVHAVPARGLAGDAAGHVRVPDRDQRADRPAGLERDAVRGAVGGRLAPAGWRSCRTAAGGSSSRAACTRTRARRWPPPRPATARRSRSCRSRAA